MENGKEGFYQAFVVILFVAAVGFFLSGISELNSLQKKIYSKDYDRHVVSCEMEH